MMMTTVVMDRQLKIMKMDSYKKCVCLSVCVFNGWHRRDKYRDSSTYTL